MATSTAAVTTGATVVFGTSAFAPLITKLSFSGIERPAIATSHLGTAAAGAGVVGNATFIAGKIIDAGTFEMEFFHNVDTLPIIGSASETVTVSLPDSSVKGTWVFTGFGTMHSMDGPLDEAMTGKLTVKISGGITRTAGS